MPTRTVFATALATCALALSACGGTAVPGVPEQTGAPTQQTGSQPTGPQTGAPSTGAPQGENRYGAPSVADPLDATKQIAAPCTSLTSAQLTALGMSETPFDRDEKGASPYCAWRDQSNRVTFSVAYIVPNENGLANLYYGQESGQMAYWEPTEVDGYPGVWQGASDQRSRGYCTVSVGLNDQLHFSVSIRGGDPATACDQSKDVAAAVVETVKSGG